MTEKPLPPRPGQGANHGEHQRRRCRNHRVRGEGGDEGKVMHGLSSPTQARGAIVERARVEPCGRRGAQVGPSLEAVPAATAGRRERQHHALAYSGLGDAGAGWFQVVWLMADS